MTDIIPALERANQQYDAYYRGGAATYLKRFFRYPLKSAHRALAKLNCFAQKTVAAKTCWGREAFVILGDKNAGSLYYFGFLPKQEYPVSLYLAKTLKANDVFYDIGANYGFYSMLAEVFAGESHVHVFEPHPLLSQCLRRTFSVNVHVNQAAVCDKEGRAILYDSYSMRHSGGSTIVKEVGKSKQIPLDEFMVDTLSLDNYVDQNQPPTFLKIDAEGAEKSIILGAKATLKKYKPKIILEIWGKELWGEYSKPSVSLLYESGYFANKINENGEIIPISRQDLEKMSLSKKYANIIFS